MHVVIALIWIGAAAAAACVTILAGTDIPSAAVDAARQPSPFAALLTAPMWKLVAITLLAGIVTVAMIVLT